VRLSVTERTNLMIALTTAIASEKELIRCHTPAFIERDAEMQSAVDDSTKLILAYNDLYNRMLEGR